MRVMNRLFPLLAALLLVALPARAQERVHHLGDGLATPADDPSPRRAATGAEAALFPVHVTHLLRERPEARQALADYQAARAAGKLPAAKSAPTDEIGDTRRFKVINFEKTDSRVVFDTLSFTLKAKENDFWIWVETAELDNGHVRDQDIDAFRTALAERTPSGSIDPNRGIIVNNEEVFGEPSDVDGNGVSFVLMVDVRDGFDGEGGYTGGFVWGGDISTSTSQGNAADILYVDTYPSLYHNGQHRSTLGIEGIAAHEYEHLIHNAHDPNEVAFVDEGLAEWAILLNGYSFRSIGYLDDTNEHNTRFLDWRHSDPDRVLNDYERAGLFTTYLAQRIGTVATGRLVQAINPANGNPAGGAMGYEVALGASNLALRDVVADFHTANVLNDRTAGVDWGYERADRQSLHAPPTRLLTEEGGLSVAVENFQLNAGAVQYFTWEDVSDLRFRLDVAAAVNPLLAGQVRPRLRLRAIVAGEGGGARVVDFDPGTTEHVIEGMHARITLLVMHQEISQPTAAFDFSARWVGSGVETETVTYDDGLLAFYTKPDGTQTPLVFSLSAAAQGAAATRFELPAAGARLAKVSLAPYFLSQFSNGGQPSTAPRDVTLKVWGQGPDGKPGAELFSKTVTDPRAHASATGTFRFFDVDLTAHAAELSALPSTVFIGYGEAGTDENYTVVGAASYAEENRSFIGNLGEGSWKALWEVQFGDSADDEYPLENTVVPVRATFVLSAEPVAVEGQELPEEITLSQNYPNPFNPTTAIRFSLPRAQEVRLAVYDVLGRQVAVLASGMQMAGTHEVQIDASTWSSGTYFYRLDAGGAAITRPMLLVK